MGQILPQFNPPPDVTIGMPVFNNAGSLTRAVQSIQAQTHRNWSLIITDDGSTDGSWQIATDLAAEDDRIAVHKNPRRQLFQNFNESLSRARTDWFVWLAADDYWGPRFLEGAFDGLAKAPTAVSALPRCRYIDAVDGPWTGGLEGGQTERFRKFLSAPGGTRMYGVMRTQIAQRSFPGANFNAFDWYFVMGLLRAGPQLDVHDVQLYRNQTPLLDYVDLANTRHWGVFRWFPVARMSLAVLRAGYLPLRNLPDLCWLNMRKHEEYMVVMKPVTYGLLMAFYRALGLPISSNPGRAAKLAANVLRTDTQRREDTTRLLSRLADRGDSAAALALGAAKRDGLIDGVASESFAEAAKLGSPDGRFHFAVSDSDLSERSKWAHIFRAVADGSEDAAAHLRKALRESSLSETIAPIARHFLNEIKQVR